MIYLAVGYNAATEQLKKQESTMSTDEVLANQRTIIANQEQILANQERILANQKEILSRFSK